EDAYAPVAEVVGDAPPAKGWVAAPRSRRQEAPTWTDEASARLERVPGGFMRTLAKTKVEEFARRIGAATVDAEVVEGGLADARELMNQMLREYHGVPQAPEVEDPSPGWTEDGVRRLNEVEVKAGAK